MGAARIPNHLYKLIKEQANSAQSEPVFKTSAGGKCHIGHELEKLAKHFGKKFGVSING